MSKRNRDAVAAQGGACNPLALAKALVAAMEEIRTETGSVLPTDQIRQDPAVRLIAHQLAFLLDVSGLDGLTEYSEAMSSVEGVQ